LAPDATQRYPIDKILSCIWGCPALLTSSDKQGVVHI
jgi:hypothetical protein